MARFGGSKAFGVQFKGEKSFARGPQLLMRHTRSAMEKMATRVATEMYRMTLDSMSRERNAVTLTGKMRANLTPVIKVKNKRIAHTFGKTSIKWWTDSTQNEVQLGVGEQTPLKYTAVQELGNRDKIWTPPMDRIFDWARQRGMNPDKIVGKYPRKGSYLDMLVTDKFGFSRGGFSPVRRGHLIWASIARKGIKGKRFMTTGVANGFLKFDELGFRHFYTTMKKEATKTGFVIR